MRSLVALALAAVVLTGCSDDGTQVEAGNPDGTSSVAGADLVGRDWRIDAVTDASGERREVDTKYDAVLRFDGEGAFSAKTCNHTGGDVVVTATELEWGDEIASTAMGCLDENLTRLESTMGTLFRGSATWVLREGELRIEGNGVKAELSERPPGFPTKLVQLATSDPASEAEWQFGYQESTAADIAQGAPRYYLHWEGRDGPGQGYGEAGLAVGPDIPMEAMWLDDVEGQLFAYGTLPIGTASAVFETTDGERIQMHPYELPDSRLVYGERVDAAKGQVVAIDADGNEIERGRIVPAG